MKTRTVISRVLFQWFLWLAAASSAMAGINEWTSLNSGLYGGNITTLVMNPVQPETLYIGTCGSGIFKTTDGGATWFAINSGLTDRRVTGIIFHPTNPEILYSSGYSGIYKSTDGGANWNYTSKGLRLYGTLAVTICASNPDVLYAGGYGGMYKSDDGGETWRALPDFTSDTASRLAVSPVNPDVVFAIASFRQIKRSVDGGRNWRYLYSVSAECLSLRIDPNNPNTLYAGTDTGLFTSIDRGLKWARVGDIPSARAVLFAGDAAHTLHVGGKERLYRKTADGDAWESLPAVPLSIGLNHIAIHPSNPGIFYLGTSEDGVFKTTDGALTWNAASTHVTDRKAHSVVFHPTNPAIAYAGTLRGIYKTGDGGGHWNFIGGNEVRGEVHAIAIHPVNPDTVYVGTEGSGIWKTTNGGGNWTSSGISESIFSLAIFPRDPDILYAGGMGGVYGTDDGGTSWSRHDAGDEDVRMYALLVHPENARTLYAGTFGNGVLKSVTGGLAWTDANSGLTSLVVSGMAMCPDNPDILYAASRGSGVFKTTDGGGGWAKVNVGVTNYHPRYDMAKYLHSIMIQPQNPDRLILGSHFGSGMFQSIDAGESWTPLSNGFSLVSVNGLAMAPDDPNRILAATDTGIFEYDISPPANDMLARATVVTELPHATIQSTLSSTAERSELVNSCGDANDRESVWFRLTPETDEEIQVLAGASDFPAVISVWTGEAHPLTEVTCGENNLSFTPVAGTVYAIRVAGNAGTGGNLADLVPTSGRLVLTIQRASDTQPSLSAVITVLKISAGMELNTISPAMDADTNGRIDVVDAVILLRRIAGNEL